MLIINFGSIPVGDETKPCDNSSKALSKGSSLLPGAEGPEFGPQGSKRILSRPFRVYALILSPVVFWKKD
jgi:hypothetical protein